MKKILLGMFSLMAIASIAQTEIEPFAPSVPGTYLGAFEEWTELDVIPDLSSNWTDEGNVSTNDIVCDAGGIAGWSFSGKYALSGAYTGENVILVSPEMDFGSNTTNPTIEFNWRNSNEGGFFGSGQLELLYKESSGGSWNVVATYTAVDNVWHNETVDLSGAGSYSTYYLGWRFTCVSTGSFYDFSLTAIDEIVVTGESGCTASANTLTVSVCDMYTVPSGDESYTTLGAQTVMDTIPNMAGCDSVLTINLTINSVDATIADNGDGTLSATSSTATYQWLENCSTTPSPIAGETNQTLDPGADGSYSCIVTENGCSDTSSCVQMIYYSIEENNASFEIYPNPSNGDVTLDLTGLSGQQLFTITDINGKLIRSAYLNGASVHSISLAVESGIYIVSLVDNDGFVRRTKLIIE